MAWYNKLGLYSQSQLDEQKKYFLNKGADANKIKEDEYGEGIEDINLLGYGSVGLQSFTKFYDKYLNRVFENEAAKIIAYRKMADSPEIGDVIEDAVNESTQEDDDGNVIALNITADHLVKNKNITKNLHKAFEELFYDKIDIDDKIWDLFKSFLIDGRLYYERIAKDSQVKNGIINMKKLPAETMDMDYDPRTGKILRFYQYLGKNVKRPNSLQEAQQREDIVVFNPEQIGFINYGSYGLTKYEMFGFLEKSKVPYNQLKLIETAIIIYRIVRAPERLVFKIDTGAMPRDKAMRFVEKIKTRFIKKQTYDPATGRLSQDPEVLCIRDTTEIPLLDGRFLSLNEIIQEYNDGKENWVYTINQETLDIEPGKIKNALITRPDEQMVRVHYDNGCYVDATLDHKFILKDGSECRADKLTSGMALMPLYTKTKILSSKLEYQKVYNPRTKKWRWTHRMVNGTTKKGEVTHHVDYNRFNNNPTNLLTMDFNEHFKHHSNKLTTDWIEHHDEKADSIREGIIKWRSNTDNVKRHSEWVIKTNIEQNKIARCLEVLNSDPVMRERQKQAARKSKIEWFNTGDNRAVFSKKKSVEYDNIMLKIVGDTLIKHHRPIRKDLCEWLSENTIMMDRFYQLNKDKPINNKQFDRITSQTLLRMIQHMGYVNYTDFRENFGLTNHRVSRIEFIEERADCGCIEVEGNHNFAISQSGKPLSFVRNSILDNFFIPTCLCLPTKIETLAGTKTLSQIIDDYNVGVKNEVISVDQASGKIIKGEVEWAGITRRNAELVRVHLDNGEHFDCTPDHKVVMRDGKEVMAGSLKPKDSVMPLYLRKEKMTPKTNDYLQIFEPHLGSWKWAHRLFGPMQRHGYAIHHRDFNRYNNMSDNLVSMPVEEHIQLHYQSNVERQSHIPMLAVFNLPENRAKQRRGASKSKIEYFKHKENRVKQGEMLSQRWKDLYDIFHANVSEPKTDQHKERLSVSVKNKWATDDIYRQKVVEGRKRDWEQEGYRENMVEKLSGVVDEKCVYYTVLELIKNNYPNIEIMREALGDNTEFMNHWSMINNDKKLVKKSGKLDLPSLYNILKHAGFNDYTSFKTGVVVNHKVAYVEVLPYTEDTGCLTIKDPGNNHNFALTCGVFVKNSSDGRGSDITTVGGNAEGFKNLDDLFHFQKALYRSLKYPLSRIEKSSEGQSSDVLFGGGHSAEITRDEIKWAKFLERQQNILCKELKKLFLLHLEFTGMKKQYSLEDTDFHIKMIPPSHYKESMEQGYLAQNFDNYNSLSNNAEFSKYYLMKKYLHWDDSEIKDNVAGLEKDKELFGDVMGGGMGGGFGGDEGGFGGQEGGLVGAEMTGEEQPEEGE